MCRRHIDGAPTGRHSSFLEGCRAGLFPVATGVSRTDHVNRNGEFQIGGVSPGFYRPAARGGGITLNAAGTMQSAHGDAQTQFVAVDVRAFRARISTDSHPTMA